MADLKDNNLFDEEEQEDRLMEKIRNRGPMYHFFRICSK